MNIEKLKKLENVFLLHYPEGFESEELKPISKKHNLQGNIDYVHKVCSLENINRGLSAFDEIVKVVTKSSMVSVFEKVKFRDLVKELDVMEKHELLASIAELLHGDEEEGFTRLISLLGFYKLAKWPILTVWAAYYNVNYDVLIKPTTVKKILKHLEIEDVKYSPKASYEFYKNYRRYINLMKENVGEKLQVSNPAFSGFLMMTIND